jgi:phosphopantothenoylcysteine synthetase/decarboxylase
VILPRGYTLRMTTYGTLYLVVTGAGTARRAPELLRRLVPLAAQTLVILTPNAQAIVSPRELALVPGARIVESYFDTAILPRPPEGVVLVAPCDFNSCNKLAQGIADNLALSVVAEAIGRRTPVAVVLSVNAPLWAHPRAASSVATLREWGCRVLEPVQQRDSTTMAPDDAVLDIVAPWLRHA